MGICPDTGNSWLGGADPVDYVSTFGSRVEHVHWKDMAAGMDEERGAVYGTGMATIPLGDGVIDLPGIVATLEGIGFDGHTTPEVAGPGNVRLSAERLNEWSAR